jgi:hypothetical protein
MKPIILEGEVGELVIAFFGVGKEWVGRYIRNNIKKNHIQPTLPLFISQEPTGKRKHTSNHIGRHSHELRRLILIT